MSAVETLRRAAALMRERAEAAGRALLRGLSGVMPDATVIALPDVEDEGGE